MPGTRRPSTALLALCVAVAGLVVTGPATAQTACTLEGTDGPDILVGTPAADVICGMAGDDHLVGGLGNDTLLGGDGLDLLEGGEGVDLLHGGPGLDLIYGGPGDDDLFGEDDMDYLEGGAGADRLDGGADADTCPVETGVDTQISCTRGSPFDANDSNGGADVQRITIGSLNAEPTWSFVMFGDFTTKAIRDHATYLVFLDTAGDLDAEYYALMRSNGSRMLAELWRTGDNGDSVVTTLDASKTNGNTVRVRVPKSSIGVGGDRIFLRWHAQTLWLGSACPNVCFDHVPNVDWLIRPFLPAS